MPAAMEKKYLSYSVRALRPNGGLDPLPRQMRKEALQASISGFSLNDPAEALRMYETAKLKQQRASELEISQADFLVREEEGRQENERRLMMLSMKARKEQLDKEWERKKEQVEIHCANILEGLDERAAATIQRVERQEASVRLPPVKVHSKTRDMNIAGRKMAKAQQYQEVLNLHETLGKSMTRESTRWIQAAEDKSKHRKVLLAERQARDRASCEERVAGIYNNFLHEREKAEQCMAMNERNVQSDMERAFKREWVAPPEGARVIKITRKSRSTTSSVFRGTIMQNALLGEHGHNIPSMSRAWNAEIKKSEEEEASIILKTAEKKAETLRLRNLMRSPIERTTSIRARGGRSNVEVPKGAQGAEVVIGGVVDMMRLTRAPSRGGSLASARSGRSLPSVGEEED
mmetsp:Transcript_57159/g.130897  ORF Transcript_57159/g.130897 Transcript_57159/m.130897 type:complete len:405 (-) Transcript_57159:329-1543(-)